MGCGAGILIGPSPPHRRVWPPSTSSMSCIIIYRDPSQHRLVKEDASRAPNRNSNGSIKEETYGTVTRFTRFGHLSFTQQ